MAAPTTVTEYLALVPPARRATMETLRQAVNATSPIATETIAYFRHGPDDDQGLTGICAGSSGLLSFLPI